MKVYTICLTVEAEPKQLAAVIKREFSQVLAYDTNGPFDVVELKTNDGRIITENTDFSNLWNKLDLEKVRRIAKMFKPGPKPMVPTSTHQRSNQNGSE